jgi:2-keto-4-pentenoate hydratase/2-oxohepta-3-ene-1,7-dioic acid hydratase in catechol pathway
MKVATVSVAGGRRVGPIATDGTSTAPFDSARSQAQDGMLAWIGHNGAGVPPMRPPLPPIDIANTPVRCSINGALRPRSNIGLLVFDRATIIVTLSAGVRLQPADVIATGTPAGIGIAIGGSGVRENEIVERTA